MAQVKVGVPNEAGRLHEFSAGLRIGARLIEGSAVSGLGEARGRGAGERASGARELVRLEKGRLQWEVIRAFG